MDYCPDFSDGVFGGDFDMVGSLVVELGTTSEDMAFGVAGGGVDDGDGVVDVAGGTAATAEGRGSRTHRAYPNTNVPATPSAARII